MTYLVYHTIGKKKYCKLIDAFSFGDAEKKLFTELYPEIEKGNSVDIQEIKKQRNG